MKKILISSPHSSFFVDVFVRPVRFCWCLLFGAAVLFRSASPFFLFLFVYVVYLHRGPAGGIRYKSDKRKKDSKAKAKATGTLTGNNTVTSREERLGLLGDVFRGCCCGSDDRGDGVFCSRV